LSYKVCVLKLEESPAEFEVERLKIDCHVFLKFKVFTEEFSQGLWMVILLDPNGVDERREALPQPFRSNLLRGLLRDCRGVPGLKQRISHVMNLLQNGVELVELCSRLAYEGRTTDVGPVMLVVPRRIEMNDVSDLKTIGQVRVTDPRM